jgi:hypothetical protein
VENESLMVLESLGKMGLGKKIKKNNFMIF